MFASAATIIASLPPHSATRGVRLSAHAAITLRAVGPDPVNATLSTPERTRAEPVSPRPVTTWKTGCVGAIEFHLSSSHLPTPGVSSDGLKTTALPAASEYAIDPMGVYTG